MRDRVRGEDANGCVLVKLDKKENRREFQVGSFGGLTGGKPGVQKEMDVPIKPGHVGIRTYRISLDEDLKPGEYAFFMGMGESATMAGARGGNLRGRMASSRIYDFSISD